MYNGVGVELISSSAHLPHPQVNPLSRASVPPGSLASPPVTSAVLAALPLALKEAVITTTIIEK